MNFYQWMAIGLVAFVVFSISDAIAKNVSRFFKVKKASDQKDFIIDEVDSDA